MCSVLTLLLGVLSGCTQPTKTDDDPANTNRGGQSCTVADDNQAFCNSGGRVQTSVFNITGTSCRRYGLPFRAPVATSTVQYPDGIKRQDSDGLTENGAFRFFACQQAEIGGRIVEDFQFGYLLLAIQRPADIDTSFNGLGWVPQAYTTDEDFQRNASAIGFAIETIRPTVIVESSISADPPTSSFEFDVPPSTTPHYRIMGTTQAATAAVNSKHALMANETQFVAIEFNGQQTLGSGAGSFEASSSSYWGQHSQAMTQPTSSAGRDDPLTIRIYLGRTSGGQS